MGRFVAFMQSAGDRGLRIVAGAALFVVGASVIGGMWGVLLAVVGSIPLIAGLAGVCYFAPVFGYSVTGRRIGTPAH